MDKNMAQEAECGWATIKQEQCMEEEYASPLTSTDRALSGLRDAFLDMGWWRSALVLLVITAGIVLVFKAVPLYYECYKFFWDRIAWKLSFISDKTYDRHTQAIDKARGLAEMDSWNKKPKKSVWKRMLGRDKPVTTEAPMLPRYSFHSNEN